MDNDLSNTTYDEQSQPSVPALLQLLFPASARAMKAMGAAARRAQAVQAELDEAMSRLNASTVSGRGNADDIVAAARQASARAARDRETAILRQLQTIDPDLTSIEAVKQKLEDCCRLKPDEAPAQPDGAIEINIDGFDDTVEAEVEIEQPDQADAYSEQLAALTAEHQKALDAMRSDHERLIDSMQARHKEEVQSLIAEYEGRIEALHLSMEKELDRVVAEKEAAAAAWRSEKADLEARAGEHTEELEEKTNALKNYYGVYAEMFDAFMERVMAVRDAYTGNDPNSPVARAISDKIMANDSYGLDDFIVDLRASLEASSADPASLRGKVRAAFLECLQTSSANWLNVLARFYAYGQAPFARKALEDAGLDMPLIDRAFVSLEDILAYSGIDLYRPRLFVDDFNPEYHTSQPIRNIDTYVPDIASHAGPDTVVDLYLVGYDDGVSQRKPVVSKFA